MVGLSLSNQQWYELTRRPRLAFASQAPICYASTEFGGKVEGGQRSKDFIPFSFSFHVDPIAVMH